MNIISKISDSNNLLRASLLGGLASPLQLEESYFMGEIEGE